MDKIARSEVGLPEDQADAVEVMRDWCREQGWKPVPGRRLLADRVSGNYAVEREYRTLREQTVREPQLAHNYMSFARVARMWAAEQAHPGITSNDLALDLMTAVGNEQFEFPQERDWRHDDGTIPANFDIRRRCFIETFDQCGQPIPAYQLRRAMMDQSQSKRLQLAEEVFVSRSGLVRWYSRPEFSEWAQVRGISRPRFLDSRITNVCRPPIGARKTGPNPPHMPPETRAEYERLRGSLNPSSKLSAARQAVRKHGRGTHASFEAAVDALRKS